MTLCRQVEEGLTGTTRIKTKRHRPEGLNLQRLRCEKLKYRPAVIASNNYRIVFYSSWCRNWTFEYYTKIRLHIVNKCSLYFVPASCSSGQQIKFSVNPVTLVIRLNWSTLPFRIVTLLPSYVRLKLLFCIFYAFHVAEAWIAQSVYWLGYGSSSQLPTGAWYIYIYIFFFRLWGATPTVKLTGPTIRSISESSISWGKATGIVELIIHGQSVSSLKMRLAVPPLLIYSKTRISLPFISILLIRPCTVFHQR